MSGRGAYYKNKYGGRGGGRGGRGRGRSSHGRGRFGDGDTAHRSLAPGTLADLQALLHSIDGRPYPAYHDLERQEWQGDSFVLRMGRAQADPFAPPTRCQIRIPAAHFVDAWPAKIVANNSSRVARVAAADHVLRHLYKACRASGADQSLGQDGGGGWSGPKGGACTILAPTQHVLEQSAVQISCDADRSVHVIVQLTISLPARGRSILGQAAQEILCQILPQLVSTICRLSMEPLWQHVHCVEDQVWLRDQLSSLDLVAFVPNGAILPRRSGVDDRPLAEGATPFESPSRWERSFELPRTQMIITGMAIPQGVTLICGGGFHGKSTLLQALQWAIYPKLAGDGREFCVVRPQATTVRAEDGRAVQAVNISDFLRDLPGGHKDTACFSTDNASGSTSQASSIAEAIELGAEALMMDEDNCAANAMIRDAKMMQLVAPGKEPITPFVRIVRALYEQLSLSTILVIGGTGDYFDVADHVLVMDSYQCYDATDRAKKIVTEFGGPVTVDAPAKRLHLKSSRPRCITRPALLQSDGKVRVARSGLISYGNTEINLTAVEQIVSASQTSAIASIVEKLGFASEGLTLRQALQSIDEEIERDGLEALGPGQFNGGFTRPRILEVGAAVNRLRARGAINQTSV